jgi:hypothetical protein
MKYNLSLTEQEWRLVLRALEVTADTYELSEYRQAKIPGHGYLALQLKDHKMAARKLAKRIEEEARA